MISGDRQNKEEKVRKKNAIPEKLPKKKQNTINSLKSGKTGR